MVILSVYPHFPAFNLTKSFPITWCELCDFEAYQIRNF